MTKYIYTYIFIFVFLLISCTNKKADDLKKVNVIPSPRCITPKLLDEFYSDIEPIPLETSAECPIGRIDKLVVNESNIFISDNHQKTLYIFNNKGDYCFKINNIGKGPGEFSVLRDFWIDTVNNQIEILGRRKIVRYSDKGKFIDEIKLSVGAFSFAKTISGNYYIWSGTQVEDRDRGTISYLNNKGKVKSEYFKWDGKGRLFTSKHMFTKTRDGLLFRPFKQDYVLREFDDDGINKMYKIDFGKHSIPENNSVKKHKLSGSVRKDIIINNKYAFGLNMQFETPNYIVFQYASHENKSTLKSFIFSKKQQTSVYCSKLNDEADLPFILAFIFYADPISDTFYSTCDAYSLITFMKKRNIKISNTKNGVKIASLLKNITYNSNPVIFKFKVNSRLFDEIP